MSQGHPPSQPGGLGGTGDILLIAFVCALHYALYYPIDYNLQDYAPHTIITLTSGKSERHNNTNKELARKAKEVRPVATKLSVMIPSSFYIYNDFACCSNNKWLRQFIPVR
jgi:hypothetical protein